VNKYDDDTALVLVRHYSFEDGEMFLLTKLQRYPEILSHYMEEYVKSSSMEEREVIMDSMHSTCTKFGDMETSLWVNMLLFLVEATDDNSSISIVLAEIERRQLLPPLVIIDIVSRGAMIQLDTIKDYVVNQLTARMAVVAEDQRALQASYEAVAKLRHDIREQLTSATVFQSNKCVACSRHLELPAVHFLCRHSYHFRCLTNAKECNICTPQCRAVLEQKEEMISEINDNDMFFKDLGEAGPSGDKFNVIAKNFGRAIFNGQYAPPKA
jgi:anion-transporting  ArsA/GET3 family ATPase